eukprot:CAMPEP_0113497528 /NCGR_PEP_ID=MMETSP0014_2-20120614/30680_1 /TAXON_ID=2857 /ORGANISM="Nitzschia sp." /LENGTH=1305 /DNA_ID=CAMNT_0000391477 /DNA_START=37 /DNA_END=3951 /DNA_ORIENTATION=- /assembly_acc=CAM_ASM_000159
MWSQQFQPPPPPAPSQAPPQQQQQQRPSWPPPPPAPGQAQVQTQAQPPPPPVGNQTFQSPPANNVAASFGPPPTTTGAGAGAGPPPMQHGHGGQHGSFPPGGGSMIQQQTGIASAPSHDSQDYQHQIGGSQDRRDGGYDDEEEEDDDGALGAAIGLVAGAASMFFNKAPSNNNASVDTPPVGPPSTDAASSAAPSFPPPQQQQPPMFMPPPNPPQQQQPPAPIDLLASMLDDPHEEESTPPAETTQNSTSNIPPSGPPTVAAAGTLAVSSFTAPPPPSAIENGPPRTTVSTATQQSGSSPFFPFTNTQPSKTSAAAAIFGAPSSTVANQKLETISMVPSTDSNSVGVAPTASTTDSPTTVEKSSTVTPSRTTPSFPPPHSTTPPSTPGDRHMTPPSIISQSRVGSSPFLPPTSTAAPPTPSTPVPANTSGTSSAGDISTSVTARPSPIPGEMVDRNRSSETSTEPPPTVLESKMEATKVPSSPVVRHQFRAPPKKPALPGPSKTGLSRPSPSTKKTTAAGTPSSTPSRSKFRLPTPRKARGTPAGKTAQPSVVKDQVPVATSVPGSTDSRVQGLGRPDVPSSETTSPEVIPAQSVGATKKLPASTPMPTSTASNPPTSLEASHTTKPEIEFQKPPKEESPSLGHAQVDTSAGSAGNNLMMPIDGKAKEPESCESTAPKASTRENPEDTVPSVEPSKEASSSSLSTGPPLLSKNDRNDPTQLGSDCLSEPETSAVDTPTLDTAIESPSDLPEGWVEATDPSSGQVYFYNGTTGETSWERPEMKNGVPKTTVENKETDSQIPALENDRGRPAKSDADDAIDTTLDALNAEFGVVDQTSGDELPLEPSNHSGQDNLEIESNLEYNLSEENQCEKSSPDEVQARNNPSSTQEEESENLLPQGWVEAVDPDTGKTFFYSPESGESSWERPSSSTENELQPVTEDESQATPVANLGDEPETTTEPVQNDQVLVDSAVGASSAYHYEPETAREEAFPEYSDNSMENDDKVQTGESDDEYAPELSGTPEANVSDLPDDWVTVQDEAGTYYYNTVSGETTWDRPTSDQPPGHPDTADTIEDEQTEPLPLDAAGGNGSLQQEMPAEDEVSCEEDAAPPVEQEEEEQLPAGWYSSVDPDSGLAFYVNEETGVTQWTRPAESDEGAAIGQEEDLDAPIADEALPSEPSETDEVPYEEEAAPPVEQEEEAEEEQLPGGWYSSVDPGSGLTFYVNEETGVTQWTHPAEADDPPVVDDDGDNAVEQEEDLDAPAADEGEAPPADQQQEEEEQLPAGWYSSVDPGSGLAFYVNEETGETQW